MQHYGAPTRLLDWTESSMMALYFAVRLNNGKQDAAVWVLNAWELNLKVIGSESVFPPTDVGTRKTDRNKLNKWLPERFSKIKQLTEMYPIAVFPAHTMRRISAQRSCFTIHGSTIDGFKKFERDKNKLKKILIAKNEIKQIRRSLETCGIDETSIFPDLEGLGRTVMHNWKSLD